MPENLGEPTIGLPGEIITPPPDDESSDTTTQDVVVPPDVVTLPDEIIIPPVVTDTIPDTTPDTVAPPEDVDFQQKLDELKQAAEAAEALKWQIAQSFGDAPTGMVDPLGLGIEDESTRNEIIQQTIDVSEALSNIVQNLLDYEASIKDAEDKLNYPEYIVDKESLAEAKKSLTEYKAYVAAMTSPTLTPYLSVKDGQIMINAIAAINGGVSDSVLLAIYGEEKLNEIKAEIKKQEEAKAIIKELSKYDNLATAIRDGKIEMVRRAQELGIITADDVVNAQIGAAEQPFRDLEIKKYSEQLQFVNPELYKIYEDAGGGEKGIAAVNDKLEQSRIEFEKLKVDTKNDLSVYVNEKKLDFNLDDPTVDEIVVLKKAGGEDVNLVILAVLYGEDKVNDAIAIINDEYQRYSQAKAKLVPYSKGVVQSDNLIVDVETGKYYDMTDPTKPVEAPLNFTLEGLAKFLRDNPNDTQTFKDYTLDQETIDLVDEYNRLLAEGINRINEHYASGGKLGSLGIAIENAVYELNISQDNFREVASRYGYTFDGAKGGWLDKDGKELTQLELDAVKWEALSDEQKEKVVNALKVDPTVDNKFAAINKSLNLLTQKAGILGTIASAPILPITNVVAKQMTIEEARDILNKQYATELDALKDYVKSNGTIDVKKIEQEFTYETQKSKDILEATGYANFKDLKENLDGYNNGIRVTWGEWTTAGVVGAIDIMSLGGAGALANLGRFGKWANFAFWTGAAGYFAPETIKVVSDPNVKGGEKTLAIVGNVALLAGGIAGLKTPKLSAKMPSVLKEAVMVSTKPQVKIAVRTVDDAVRAELAKLSTTSRLAKAVATVKDIPDRTVYALYDAAGKLDDLMVRANNAYWDLSYYIRKELPSDIADTYWSTVGKLDEAVANARKSYYQVYHYLKEGLLDKAINVLMDGAKSVDDILAKINEFKKLLPEKSEQLLDNVAYAFYDTAGRADKVISGASKFYKDAAYYFSVDLPSDVVGKYYDAMAGLDEAIVSARSNYYKAYNFIKEGLPDKAANLLMDGAAAVDKATDNVKNAIYEIPSWYRRVEDKAVYSVYDAAGKVDDVLDKVNSVYKDTIRYFSVDLPVDVVNKYWEARGNLDAAVVNMRRVYLDAYKFVKNGVPDKAVNLLMDAAKSVDDATAKVQEVIAQMQQSKGKFYERADALLDETAMKMYDAAGKLDKAIIDANKFYKDTAKYFRSDLPSDVVNVYWETIGKLDEAIANARKAYYEAYNLFKRGLPDKARELLAKSTQEIDDIISGFKKRPEYYKTVYENLKREFSNEVNLAEAELQFRNRLSEIGKAVKSGKMTEAQALEAITKITNEHNVLLANKAMLLSKDVVGGLSVVESKIINGIRGVLVKTEGFNVNLSQPVAGVMSDNKWTRLDYDIADALMTDRQNFNRRVAENNQWVTNYDKWTQKMERLMKSEPEKWTKADYDLFEILAKDRENFNRRIAENPELLSQWNSFEAKMQRIWDYEPAQLTKLDYDIADAIITDRQNFNRRVASNNEMLVNYDSFVRKMDKLMKSEPEKWTKADYDLFEILAKDRENFNRRIAENPELLNQYNSFANKLERMMNDNKANTLTRLDYDIADALMTDRQNFNRRVAENNQWVTNYDKWTQKMERLMKSEPEKWTKADYDLFEILAKDRENFNRRIAENPELLSQYNSFINKFERMMRSKSPNKQLIDELEEILGKKDELGSLKFGDKNIIDDLMNKTDEVAKDIDDPLLNKKLNEMREYLKKLKDESDGETIKLVEKEPIPPERGGGTAVKEKIEVKTETKPKTPEQLERELYPETKADVVEKSTKSISSEPTPKPLPIIVTKTSTIDMGEIITLPPDEIKRLFGNYFQIVPAGLPYIISDTGVDISGEFKTWINTEQLVKELGELQPVPQFVLQPLPQSVLQPQPVPQAVPQPIPQPVTQPVPQPQPQPLLPPVPEGLKTKLKPIIPFKIELPQEFEESEEINEKLKYGFVTWRQGKTYWAIPQREDGSFNSDDKIASGKPFRGTTKFAKGKGSTYKTMQYVGKNPPEKTNIDIGFAQFSLVREGNDVKITRIYPDETANWDGTNRFTSEEALAEKKQGVRKGSPITDSLDLTYSTESSEGAELWFDIIRDGKVVGKVKIVDKEESVSVRDIVVDPEYRLKGIALSSLEEISELLGKPLDKSSVLTATGKALQESLSGEERDELVSEVINEIEEVEEAEPEKKVPSREERIAKYKKQYSKLPKSKVRRNVFTEVDKSLDKEDDYLPDYEDNKVRYMGLEILPPQVGGDL